MLMVICILILILAIGITLWIRYSANMSEEGVMFFGVLDFLICSRKVFRTRRKCL